MVHHLLPPRGQAQRIRNQSSERWKTILAGSQGGKPWRSLLTEKARIIEVLPRALANEIDPCSTLLLRQGGNRAVEVPHFTMNTSTHTLINDLQHDKIGLLMAVGRPQGKIGFKHFFAIRKHEAQQPARL